MANSQSNQNLFSGLGGTGFDPFGAAAGLAGLGLEIFGGMQQADYANQESQISQKEIGVQQQQDQVRRSAMELSAGRQQTEQVRQNQMARSMALSSTTASGAQFGSALGGAYGSISGQTNTNLTGISQNLQFGERMFDLNNSLDQLKIQMAGVEGNKASSQGLGAIGAGLLGAAKFL